MHEQHLFSDSSVQSSVLQLCEVKIIYSQKLIKMSVKEPDVNETKGKTFVPYSWARKGREVILVFKAYAGPAKTM